MTQWGLDTLFNPSKRHMDEEKRRLQATRQQIGDASGGKRIDLDSGKVRIGRRGRDEDEADESSDEASADAADEGAAKGSSNDTGPTKDAKKPEKANKPEDKPEPSPAAIRAAQRRGRQPR